MFKWFTKRKKRPEIEIYQLENTEEELRGVHLKDLCLGGPCPIHDMTDHPMRDLPQHYRCDNGLMERICPHGIGHPDPDGMDAPGYYPEHGCDGCCSVHARALRDKARAK